METNNTTIEFSNNNAHVAPVRVAPIEVEIGDKFAIKTVANNPVGRATVKMQAAYVAKVRAFLIEHDKNGEIYTMAYNGHLREAGIASAKDAWKIQRIVDFHGSLFHLMGLARPIGQYFGITE